MTQSERVLAFLLMVHKVQPNYATRAAENYAKLNPFDLGDMPQLLARALLHKPSISS